ncbi:MULTISPECIES: DUF5753 domain-containing protein [Saccharothrix]|uniref:DUF5753 domain-containing protein n=1 Tax=Saccharothrix TaxID=2071 RepID=UPI00093EC36C|nr:DUF5753 domain-containing protein [Saccharothrix sp. CB00851]OKI37908.1 hypothetical protein A6A25_17390 [Saccharothrix sp. CB00851]
MTDQVDPYDARMKFAKLARQLREAAGLGQGTAEAELIEVVGGYDSLLSKLETAQRVPKPAHVAWMLTRYNPSAVDAAALQALADAAGPRAKATVAGVQAREYIARIRRAERIWMIYDEIPGSLQKRQFAYWALQGSPFIEPGDVDAVAQDRAERGEWIFRPDGPEVWIVLGEGALDRLAGPPDVEAEEIEHLRDVAGREKVHFRIVPNSVGFVTGLSNPFTLLRSEADGWLAYVGHFARNDYVKKGIHRFREVFDDAWDRGVSEEQTRAILDVRIADLRQH